MSTDMVAVCDTCREEIHLGQRMGSGYSFGYGPRDAIGHGRAAEWCVEHAIHGRGVRVLVAQTDLHEETVGYARPAWDL